jgi:acyl carrier protein
MENVTEMTMNVVYSAIEELNEQFPEENRLEKTPETILLGDAGRLDSVGFVNLIALVEERCEEALGLFISITDGFGNLDANPSTTVGDLVDYLCRVIKEEMAK